MAEDKKEQRAKELQLWHAFNKSPSPQTFQPLYESLKPIIVKAVQKNAYKSSIPRAAHLAYGAQSFLEAVRTFSPDKGNLHTHIYGAIENKGKRLNYKYQNIGYIPEARVSKFGPIDNAITMLRSELGREPSAIEVADEVGLSVKTVETFMKEQRGSLLLDDSLSRGQSYFQSDRTMQLARDIQYSLIPQHQVVHEHIFGLNGKEPLLKPGGGADKERIAKTTGLSMAQVNSAFKSISRRMRQYAGQLKTESTEDQDE